VNQPISNPSASPHSYNQNINRKKIITDVSRRGAEYAEIFVFVGAALAANTPVRG